MNRIVRDCLLRFWRDLHTGCYNEAKLERLLTGDIYYPWMQVQQKWAVVRGNSTVTFSYIEAALEFYSIFLKCQLIFLVSEIVNWWRISEMRSRFFTYKYQPFIKKYHNLEPRPMARVHKKLFDLFLYLNILIPKNMEWALYPCTT